MRDPQNTLNGLFRFDNRWANFGDVLVSLHVQGFRCHSDTFIEINSPITAFCGLNGTGKSTLLQLAAVAYRDGLGALGRYYVVSFFVSGTLDPAPFSPDAAVEYGYWQETRLPRKLTVSRRQLRKRWTGYRNQPVRQVYFAGMGLYLPQIETRDYAVRHARTLEILSKEALAAVAKQWVERILTNHYDTMVRNMIKHPRQNRYVVTACRNGCEYSEANMGCGEGRVQHFVQQIENLPNRSLILLEEPETSLHQSAQFELGRYLMDVCIRRRHQVLLTTHSESLLAALPSVSRVFLERRNEGMRPIYGLSSAQAASLMANAGSKALHVLVEDDVALAILREIVRKSDPNFLRTIEMRAVGDKDAIQKTMQTLVALDLPIAAVRDADAGPNPQQNLFSLPGTRPPEVELLTCPAVAQLIKTQYGIELATFMTTVDPNDHHGWLSNLADSACTDDNALLSECSRAYVSTIAENECDALVAQLKAAIR